MFQIGIGQVEDGKLGWVDANLENEHAQRFQSISGRNLGLVVLVDVFKQVRVIRHKSKMSQLLELTNAFHDGVQLQL